MNELEKALRVIKEECEKHTKCEKCPLRDGGILTGTKCYLRNHNPEDYFFESDTSPESKRIFG